MNLIKQLFGHHRHEESASPATVNWPGQSGKGYQYTVYSLDTAFQPLPGMYIYAGQAEDGSWAPVYIAQTRDLHQRLEGHVRTTTPLRMAPLISMPIIAPPVRPRDALRNMT